VPGENEKGDWLRKATDQVAVIQKTDFSEKKLLGSTTVAVRKSSRKKFGIVRF